MSAESASAVEAQLVDLSFVTYNSAKWIPELFRSLAEGDFPLANLAIYVADHGSTDGTLEAIEAARATLPGLRLLDIARYPNRGFGAGHNANLTRATAPWFLVSNLDLEFEKDSIIRVLACALAAPERCASFELRQKPYEHPKPYHAATGETTWSSSACILFRRSALVDVGGYDENFFMYGEDIELSFRLRDRGYLLRYCPQATVWHYSYQSAGEIKPMQFFGSVLGNFLIRLRYGTRAQIAAIPGMWLRLLLRPGDLPRYRMRILGMGARLAWLAPRFLLSRKRSAIAFPIRGFDYDIARDGAFFEYPRTSAAKGAGYPLASVIVRTYQGRLGYLAESTRSIANQTYPNIELLVVEDGETGFGRDLVAAVARPGLSVRYLTSPKGERAKTGNVGLAAARGEFMMFLDDDDLLFADHLEVLTDILCATPSLGAAYANAWEVETLVHSTDPLSYTEVLHKAVFRQPFCRPLMWIRNFIPIQSIVFRRRLYERHGGFDLDCPPLEDWNLWTRYCFEDDFVYVPKTTSIYRTPADSGERSKRQGVLDVTYARAAAKQKALPLNITPQEFLVLHRELNAHEHADFRAFHDVKAFLKRYALGAWMVERAKAVYRRFPGDRK